jgi:hypothetical protein
MRSNALLIESVKGTGFSPYPKVYKRAGALAPEAPLRTTARIG